MDLRGEYQRMNLRTALSAIGMLRGVFGGKLLDDSLVEESLEGTASKMGFPARWEMVSRDPDVICDIGHNAAALKCNFSQLRTYLKDGTYSSLIIVYGVMADKCLDDILPLFPEEATYVFTTPSTRRALLSKEIMSRYSAFRISSGSMVGSAFAIDRVGEAVEFALGVAKERPGKPLVYVGGSTFVVSEALEALGRPSR